MGVQSRFRVIICVSVGLTWNSDSNCYKYLFLQLSLRHFLFYKRKYYPWEIIAHCHRTAKRFSSHHLIVQRIIRGPHFEDCIIFTLLPPFGEYRKNPHLSSYLHFLLRLLLLIANRKSSYGSSALLSIQPICAQSCVAQNLVAIVNHITIMFRHV